MTRRCNACTVSSTPMMEMLFVAVLYLTVQRMRNYIEGGARRNPKDTLPETPAYRACTAIDGPQPYWNRCLCDLYRLCVFDSPWATQRAGQ